MSADRAVPEPDTSGASPNDAQALALLRSDSPPILVDNILANCLQRSGHRHAIAWSSDWPHAISVSPDLDETQRARAEAVVTAARCGAAVEPGARILCDDGHGAVAVLLSVGDARAWNSPCLDVAGRRLSELLTLHGLRNSVTRLEQAEQLQRALFAIADIAGSDLEMPDVLRGLHRIVSELMYAENFYIALYNENHDTLRFVYFVDTEETEPPPDADLPMSRFERGLTWYVIHDRKPLLGTNEQIQQQVSGPLQLRGVDSYDWLGVPLLREGKAYGAVVVQSYLSGIGFTPSDKALLTFVAEHILTALERRYAKEALEQRVEQRTRELAEVNSNLRVQVAERERAEHLQATLYRIAALANVDESSEGFYRHIHLAVGELLNTENFYIELLSKDGTQL